MHRRLRRCTVTGVVVAALITPNVVQASSSARAAHAATVTNCGTTIAKPGGGTWKCTFDEEFDATAVDSTKWWKLTTASTGFTSGGECYVTSPNNISVANGSLRLTVRKEAQPFACTTPTGSFTTQYTSGELTTYGRFAQAYGRFEVRAKFPATTIAGLQSALWMTPQTANYGAWPASGEIDIAESYSVTNAHPMPTFHYLPVGGKDPNMSTGKCTISKPANFHAYTLTWTKTSLTVAFDGKTCLGDSWNPAAPLVKPQPFDQPFVMTLTQALGVSWNAFKAGTTPLPATTEVDYVRIWS